MFYTLTHYLGKFCLYPENLDKGELKIIFLMEEIVRQVSIQAVPQLLVLLLSRSSVREEDVQGDQKDVQRGVGNSNE